MCSWCYKRFKCKVFNLISRTNETKFITWHETCKCICRLDAIVCYNKQQWNKNKCRCEGKEFIDKGICDKGFIWNPNNCECECDKNCDIGEYLDNENCKFRKKLADKFIDECTETIEETKLANITFTENENNYGHNSCIVYIVLIIVAFTMFTRITASLVYYNWSLINNNIYCIRFNNRKKKIKKKNWWMQLYKKWGQ